MQEYSKTDIKLNIGCASRPLLDYINIDLDSLEAIKARYPQQQFPEGLMIYQYDIFNLPFEADTVAEIRMDGLIEHLNFVEEQKFFYEARRVLRPGGILRFSTPDFEKTIQLWLAAKDDWKDFYRIDDEAIKQEHWFGTYSYATDNRWGYLTAMIFGSQNGKGQYHKNCYTITKIKAILKRLNFEEIEISQFRWKDNRDHMINVIAKKI